MYGLVAFVGLKYDAGSKGPIFDFTDDISKYNLFNENIWISIDIFTEVCF